ncbi:Pup--protein ligase [Brevibacterium sp. 91QC2O2]|uniref:Pup--protein ligase n=1 Tax=Brevibacterium TaxID=1696 RepID=UPI00211C338F|nr:MULTISPECIES: Pup--protein ligase [unclassified Brevibacterium]MCQ9366803.1 Pup--protein ligase [Brevibacterium sp. 91QC2O2]MCQ9383953.1 Pup--protein ligase [Brevibacterium sp. 68QC2CO]
MRRIFGIETEYGIAFTATDGRRLGPEEVARYLFRPIVAWGRSSNVFLPNGSRFYLDVGSHPEYASAECDSVHDLVVQDKAGESLMAGLLDTAVEAMAADGVHGRPHLVKNNQDSAGNSYGSHENYLIRRSMDFTHLTTTLLPFLVVRQLLVGSGAVLPKTALLQAPPAETNRVNPHAPGQTPTLAADELVYGLSSRADVMWEGVSSATTRSRPIINARDEPHADAEKYRRLHVIVGDSSIAEPTTELKVGSAALILDLIETGATLGDLSLRNPIRDIRTVARDLTGSTRLELASGKVMTTRELLGVYLEHATRLVASGNHSIGDDATAARVLDLWTRMLTAVESGDFSQVDTEIDWVIKKKLFDRYLERSDAGLDDARIARLDFAYHDISADTGMYHKLVAAGLIARRTTDAEVTAATTTPPQTTRAKLRGAFVGAAHAARRDFTVDWVHLRVNDQSQRAVMLKDPFKAADEQAEGLIAGLSLG